MPVHDAAAVLQRVNYMNTLPLLYAIWYKLYARTYGIIMH